METVWIMGAGRFGALALDRLSKLHKDWRFVVVDTVKEHLPKVSSPQITLVHSNAIDFLNDGLKPDTTISWIIPSLPLHLAWEWCRMKLGPDRLVRRRIPPGIESSLPNSMQGANKDLYVSNADVICPDNCSEPENVCTVTKQPRKQDMFHRLETLDHKGYTPIVLQSRQLGPGIGGYTPGQLFFFLNRVEQHCKGSLLLCTACRCHGVVTGCERVE